MAYEDEDVQVSDVAVLSNQEVSSIYQSDKAFIDTQIATAKQFPRNITRATNDCIAIVTRDKKTAETCNYAVPRGGKAITGPSVHLARIMMQQWGNFRAEARVVGIDATHVYSEAVAFDLEKNVAVKIQVKRSIVGKKGRFNEDMITVTGNAANAIAYRNAVFSVIDRGSVDKVYNAAKMAITGNLSEKTKLVAKRKEVIDALKDTYSVTEKEILSAIGRASIELITADDILVLIGIGTAIVDGDTDVEKAFRSDRTPKNSKDAEAERIELLIKDAKSVEQLEKLKKNVPEGQMDLFNQRLNELK